MTEFNTNLADAPKDEIVVLLLPDPADPENPYIIATGGWDEEANRWTGSWRDFEDTEDLEPVAWGYAPEITEEADRAVMVAIEGEQAAA